MSPIEAYIAQVAGRLHTDPARVRLYWKGRVALYAALRAAGIGRGDEVIVPALTCVVVPNAILYCGAMPVYADVRADTLTADPESVARLISPRTRAIIIQNTFGLSADVRQLTRLAHAHDAVAIEDCTHGFGGMFQGQPNGSLADAAFFSTQWNKPYSTGLGGILVVNQPARFPRLRNVDRAAVAPGRKELASLWLSMQVRRHLMNDATYWRLLRWYRRLSRAGLVTGSSSAGETDSTVMPDAYFKLHSPLQARAGATALQQLDDMLARRRRVAAACRAVLRAHGKWHVCPMHDADNSHLKLPVLAPERERLSRAAERARVRLCDWFVSPIHPVQERFSDWHLSLDNVPTAWTLSRKLLTVNTDVADATHVCRFLEDNLDLIE